MKRIVLFFTVLVAFSLLWAVIWPVDIEYAVSGFGLWFNGTINRGVVFAAQNAPVHAPADGEVVFQCTNQTLFGGFPVPEGSLLVCKNQGDILTVFTGIIPALTPEQNPVFKEHDILGTTKDYPNANLFAYVFDLKNTVYLHPHHVFPVVKENLLPQVRTVLLVHDDSEVSISSVKSIKQGNWIIKFRASDTVTANYFDGIKKVKCLIDGAEKQTVTLDTIAVKNGRLLYQVNNTWEKGVVDKNGFILLGPVYIIKGKTIISIVLEDFYGNEKTYSWPVTVD